MKKLFHILGLMLILPQFAQAQPESGSLKASDMNQARSIRIHRMSLAWVNEPIEVRLNSGLSVSGIMMGVNDGYFQVRRNQNIELVPIDQAREVILKRKPQDLLLVGLSML